MSEKPGFIAEVVGNYRTDTAWGRPMGELTREELLEVVNHLLGERDAQCRSMRQMAELDRLTPPA